MPEQKFQSNMDYAAKGVISGGLSFEVWLSGRPVGTSSGNLRAHESSGRVSFSELEK